MIPLIAIFITLNGTVYEHGDTVPITDIGTFTSDGAGLSLVCDTSNANTQCCRISDNAANLRIPADWYFPNGRTVPAHSDNPEANFTRRNSAQQLRLSRQNNALTPIGSYTCRVPDEVNSALVHEATITLMLGKLMCSTTKTAKTVKRRMLTLMSLQLRCLSQLC